MFSYQPPLVYVTILGPYTDAPIIYVFKNVYDILSTPQRSQYSYKYDCTVGSFIKSQAYLEIDGTKHRLPKFFETKEQAVLRLVELIQQKEYQNKTNHFKGFVQHWPEYFI